jgi:hypothetical protein
LALSRPCAVIVFSCPSIGMRARMSQFWNMTAASPMMKSTVPEIVHSQ